METVILFIDTNGFIQLRDLKDLNWRKLFPRVKHIRILVARPVIKELDKHKTSTNDRRRNRARLALKMIAEASKAPDRTLILKEKSVRLTLEIAPRGKLNWESFSDLDPNSSDDHLVAAAYLYGNSAAILSHDTGPRITAHDVGLQAYEPLDDWHLPAEQSDDQRRIGVLERELKHAKSTKPQLRIEIIGCDDGNLTLFIPILPELDEETVARLTDKYLAKHPRAAVKSVSDHMSAILGRGLSHAEVSSYHARYNTFGDHVRKFFQTLHQSARFLASPTVSAVISNVGSVSARNFHVTAEASGDFGIFLPDERRKFAPIPKPPPVPKPVDPLSIGNPFLNQTIPDLSPPHATEIRWIERPELGAKFASHGCGDFRPERDDALRLALWPEGALPVAGTLTVTASANDVPETREVACISIEERTHEWDNPRVTSSFPDFVQEVLVDR